MTKPRHRCQVKAVKLLAFSYRIAIINCYLSVIGEYEELHFTGESANEAEDFIQAVNKRAYAAGKQKDNAWIAEFAYPFFSRKALRWYETLGEEIQNDWKLLKRAILVEYCGEQPSPSTVPFAAPASFR